MNSLKFTLIQSVRYRGGKNHWAWLLHRLTGVGLVLFLLMLTVMILGAAAISFAPAPYARAAEAFFNSPVFGIGMILLVLCTVFHVLNGTRVATLDILPGMSKKSPHANNRKISLTLQRREAWWWIFLRISAAAILVLVSVTMTGLFDPDVTLQQRWAQLGWRIFDVTVLAVVWAHGLRGMVQVLQDYVHRPSGMKLANRLILILGGLTFLLCAAVLLFSPWSV